MSVDYQKLLLEHLDLIERVVRYIARRHHLTAADAEEFASVVRFKLIDRDFAILRKFQGRSNLATYLTTVVERLYLDFCIARWGKWRPSSAAKRLGPLAVLLEQMLCRDGRTFEEAVSTLQIDHQCKVTREELQRIYHQLPVRSSRRFAPEEELALARVQVGAIDHALDHRHDLEIVERVERALVDAVADLSTLDRLVLKFRFADGLSMTDIGRLVHIPPKQLYRQLQQVVELLRRKLLERGVEPNDIERVVGHPALTLGRVFSSSREGAGEPGIESV